MDLRVPALLLALIPLACTERTLGDDASDAASDAYDDEIIEHCMQGCPRAQECGFIPEGADLTPCIEGCIKMTRALRPECEPGFTLDLCISSLSCTDRAAYEAVLDQLNGWIEFTADYPCRDENVTYMMECLSYHPIEPKPNK